MNTTDTTHTYIYMCVCVRVCVCVCVCVCDVGMYIDLSSSGEFALLLALSIDPVGAPPPQVAAALATGGEFVDALAAQ